MAAKTAIDLFIDSAVSASTTVNSDAPAVASGKNVRVKRFGCFDPLIGDGIDSIVILQWGSTGSFTSIRAIGKNTELNLDKVFVGDGVKHFRLKRINQSSSAKIIAAWIEALVDDA